MNKTAKIVLSTVTAVAVVVGATLGVYFGYSQKTERR